MTKKENENNGKGLLAFITGAVAGAAAVFLAKKENREKVKEKAEEAKKMAEKTKKEVEKKAKELKKKAEKKKAEQEEE